jgi:hypothetical protein
MPAVRAARPLLGFPGRFPMKSMVSRIMHAMSVFVAGWSYRRWDPPYPGDGI